MQHANAGKVHLCTLPARDSNYIFFLSDGWAGGFPARDLGDCLPSIVVARHSPLVSAVVHILAVVCQPTQIGGHADRRQHTRTL